MSVNRRVTAKRERENPEYMAMVRRMIAAGGRRVAQADPEDLAELIALREAVEAAIETAVTGQRETLGASWADVARGLGVTRQYAQRRYGESQAG